MASTLLGSVRPVGQGFGLASGHTILSSGRLDGHRTKRVALIMSRKMERTLIEWKPSGSRLLKAKFNSKYTKLTVIVGYAQSH